MTGTGVEDGGQYINYQPNIEKMHCPIIINNLI